MQKQWFLFGSAASMAFVLVILGGIFGNSLARKPSGDWAAQMPIQAASSQTVLGTNESRKPASIRLTEDHERFGFGEHAEEREED